VRGDFVHDQVGAEDHAHHFPARSRCGAPQDLDVRSPVPGDFFQGVEKTAQRVDGVPQGLAVQIDKPRFFIDIHFQLS